MSINISLPDWLVEYESSIECIQNPEDRMKFVLEAARRNIVYKTGGPFSAAVFELETGRLISLGVNLVTTENLSCLHAEIVALSFAQKKLGSFDLARDKAHELVCSTEPCAMCFGAIPWSGVVRVVSSATDEDARAIGFDEGPKVSDWRSALKSRGIDVVDQVCRDAGRDILDFYQAQQGVIYNSRDSLAVSEK